MEDIVKRLARCSSNSDFQGALNILKENIHKYPSNSLSLKCLGTLVKAEFSCDFLKPLFEEYTNYLKVLMERQKKQDLLAVKKDLVILNKELAAYILKTVSSSGHKLSFQSIVENIIQLYRVIDKKSIEQKINLIVGVTEYLIKLSGHREINSITRRCVLIYLADTAPHCEKRILRQQLRGLDQSLRRLIQYLCCGDYQMQEAIMVVLLHHVNESADKGGVLKKWFSNFPKMAEYVEYLDTLNIYSSIRNFLILLNKNAVPAKVFSVACHKCLANGNLVISKPKESRYTELWVDFSLDTKIIHLINDGGIYWNRIVMEHTNIQNVNSDSDFLGHRSLMKLSLRFKEPIPARSCMENVQIQSIAMSFECHQFQEVLQKFIKPTFPQVENGILALTKRVPGKLKSQLPYPAISKFQVESTSNTDSTSKSGSSHPKPFVCNSPKRSVFSMSPSTTKKWLFGQQSMLQHPPMNVGNSPKERETTGNFKTLEDVKKFYANLNPGKFSIGIRDAKTTKEVKKVNSCTAENGLQSFSEISSITNKIQQLSKKSEDSLGSTFTAHYGNKDIKLPKNGLRNEGNKADEFYYGEEMYSIDKIKNESNLSIANTEKISDTKNQSDYSSTKLGTSSVFIDSDTGSYFSQNKLLNKNSQLKRDPYIRKYASSSSISRSSSSSESNFKMNSFLPKRKIRTSMLQKKALQLNPHKISQHSQEQKYPDKFTDKSASTLEDQILSNRHIHNYPYGRPKQRDSIPWNPSLSMVVEEQSFNQNTNQEFSTQSLKTPVQQKYLNTNTSRSPTISNYEKYKSMYSLMTDENNSLLNEKQIRDEMKEKINFGFEKCEKVLNDLNNSGIWSPDNEHDKDIQRLTHCQSNYISTTDPEITSALKNSSLNLPPSRKLLERTPEIFKNIITTQDTPKIQINPDGSSLKHNEKVEISKKNSLEPRVTSQELFNVNREESDFVGKTNTSTYKRPSSQSSIESFTYFQNAFKAIKIAENLPKFNNNSESLGLGDDSKYEHFDSEIGRRNADIFDKQLLPKEPEQENLQINNFKSEVNKWSTITANIMSDLVFISDSSSQASSLSAYCMDKAKENQIHPDELFDRLIMKKNINKTENEELKVKNTPTQENRISDPKITASKPARTYSRKIDKNKNKVLRRPFEELRIRNFIKSESSKSQEGSRTNSVKKRKLFDPNDNLEEILDFESQNVPKVENIKRKSRKKDALKRKNPASKKFGYNNTTSKRNDTKSKCSDIFVSMSDSDRECMFMFNHSQIKSEPKLTGKGKAPSLRRSTRQKQTVSYVEISDHSENEKGVHSTDSFQQKNSFIHQRSNQDKSNESNIVHSFEKGQQIHGQEYNLNSTSTGNMCVGLKEGDKLHICAEDGRNKKLQENDILKRQTQDNLNKKPIINKGVTHYKMQDKLYTHCEPTLDHFQENVIQSVQHKKDSNIDVKNMHKNKMIPSSDALKPTEDTFIPGQFTEDNGTKKNSLGIEILSLKKQHKNLAELPENPPLYHSEELHLGNDTLITRVCQNKIPVKVVDISASSSNQSQNVCTQNSNQIILEDTPSQAEMNNEVVNALVLEKQPASTVQQSKTVASLSTTLSGRNFSINCMQDNLNNVESLHSSNDLNLEQLSHIEMRIESVTKGLEGAIKENNKMAEQLIQHKDSLSSLYATLQFWKLGSQ